MKKLRDFFSPLFLCFALTLLFSFPVISSAGSLEKGFDALKIFNYFEAKELLEKSLRSHLSGAAYGLSTIFFRKDNPFHNIDSAYQYIVISEKSFKSSDAKEKELLLKLKINLSAISDLKEKIIQEEFEKTKTENTIESYNRFIKMAPPGLKKEAIKLRNTFAFENAKKANTVQGYKDFISGYPEADEIKSAKELYELSLFSTLTQPSTIESYVAFVKQFLKSPYRAQAEDSVYAFSTRNASIQEYHSFIKEYPENHNIKKAWDIIYSLSTLDFTPSSIGSFLFDFPDFPDISRVKTDLERAKTTLFLIQQNGKWGFIDSLGNIRIPATYDLADDFSEGVAAVTLEGKAGYIRKTGSLVIPLIYEEANAFRAGFAVVKKNGKQGLIDKTGKQILPFEFKDINYNETSGNEKIFRVQEEEGYRFYNVKGKLVFEGKFEKAGDFSSGRAYILQNEKYGFINKKGEIIIPVSYDWAENFHHGIARVKQGDKFGLIDTSGNMLLGCIYDKIDNFSEDLALVVKEKKLGFVDTKGKLIIPLKFDYSSEISAGNGFQNGLAKVEQNKKRGLIDKTGKFVIPCAYEDIRNFAEDLCAVKKGKWGFIDKNAKQKINFQFDYAWDFSDGLGRIKIKGKTGFINPKGEQIVPVLYEEARDFKNNISIVTLGEKKGVIDSLGKLLVPCQMDEIAEAEKTMLKIEKNEKSAYYNISLRKQVWAETGF